MNGRRLIPGKPLPASEVPDYSVARDTLQEDLSPRFATRLRQLNEIVFNSGEPLEGNIFYPHGDALVPTAPPTAELAAARRNVWRATRFKRSFLEIGVNAGHSALLALSTNSELIYYGIDLNEHAYTEACVRYLRTEFPGRVEFFAGNSLDVLPALASRRAEFNFDLFHVDGGHTSAVCASDVSYCIQLAAGRRGTHLVIDDTHASWIFDIVCEQVALGNLTAETFFDDWEEAGHNLLARIL